MLFYVLVTVHQLTTEVLQRKQMRDKIILFRDGERCKTLWVAHFSSGPLPKAWEPEVPAQYLCCS